jgi:hypothetical protein
MLCGSEYKDDKKLNTNFKNENLINDFLINVHKVKMKFLLNDGKPLHKLWKQLHLVKLLKLKPVSKCHHLSLYNYTFLCSQWQYLKISVMWQQISVLHSNFRVPHRKMNIQGVPRTTEVCEVLYYGIIMLHTQMGSGNINFLKKENFTRWSSKAWSGHYILPLWFQCL